MITPLAHLVRWTRGHMKRAISFIGRTRALGSYRDLVLRPYQKECLEASVSSFKKGVKSQAVSLPVGSGKTIVFAELITRIQPPATRNQATKTLVLAHRDELLEQAFTKICQADSNLRVDIEQGSRTASLSADVIVASVPSLGRMGSDRLSRFNPDDFKCIVIDEAHHSPSPTYTRILDHFGALNLPDKPRSHVLVWGCSATLRRHDGIRLSDIFEEVSYYKTILDLWEDGWLCPAKAFRVLTDTDISDVKKIGSDFNLSQLAAKLDTSSRNSAIVRAWKQHVDSDARYSTLVFAVDVAHVQNLTATFRDAGIEAHYVDGNTPRDERFDLLEGFRQRDYPVLVNCQVFTEGTDIPGVDCIVMARPTASPVLFQQMLGRGLRLHPGKQDCVLLDCVDVCQKRGVVTLPSLLGLAPHFNMKGVSAYDIYKRMKELVDTEADCLASESLEEAERISTEGLDVGVRLNEITLRGDASLQQSSPAPSRRYAWIKLSGGSFGLQLIKAGELLVFKKSDGDYQLYLRSKETESAKRYSKTKDLDHRHRHSFLLLGSFDSLQSAFNGASTYIASHGHSFARLTERKAAWRSKPATQRQIELVNKLYCNRVHNTGTMAQGRASQLLGRWFLRQSLSQLRKYIDSPSPQLKPMFETAWLNKRLAKVQSQEPCRDSIVSDSEACISSDTVAL